MPSLDFSSFSFYSSFLMCLYGWDLPGEAAQGIGPRWRRRSMLLTLPNSGSASISRSVTLLILDLALSSFLLFHLPLLLLTGDRKHS